MRRVFHFDAHVAPSQAKLPRLSLVGRRHPNATPCRGEKVEEGKKFQTGLLVCNALSTDNSHWQPAPAAESRLHLINVKRLDGQAGPYR